LHTSSMSNCQRFQMHTSSLFDKRKKGLKLGASLVEIQA
jgi:hypothetical protein